MTETPTIDLDAVVIGAGFGGIYMLKKLRDELGLQVRAFDRAGGVGGTWYWNRYPGAKSDTESFVYQYSFDRELLQEWEWNTRYLEQPDILAYLEAVVDRHDLRGDIQLNTGVDSLVFDDDTGLWTVGTDDGQTLTARYVVCAVGLLSKTNLPDIEGRDSFQGRLLHTGAWPQDLTLEGKRVGVIGTGSTGTQFICAASKTADHLTVFQRSPQYVVPSGNGPVGEDYVSAVKRDYDLIWDQVRTSMVAFGFEESTVPAMSVSAEERQRVFQENWDKGNGLRFMFGTFSDLAVDEAANEAAAALQAEVARIRGDHPDWPGLRVGVNSGPVVFSEMGGGYVVYPAVGDTANMAARLQEQAPVGGVLIGTGTRDQLPGAVDLLPVRGLHLQGKDAAVDAYLVQLPLRTSSPTEARPPGRRGVPHAGR